KFWWVTAKIKSSVNCVNYCRLTHPTLFTFSWLIMLSRVADSIYWLNRYQDNHQNFGGLRRKLNHQSTA
ncbi:alpha-E domain-containing protein, partial [Microcystis sp. M53603_WE2]|uniref:alpha-E domain-containing protein n=1 Tax=Microcystis sp. M53603_WE2 TaxID=3030678 RepID=UPI002585B635